jgi:hypothetical protein
MMGLRTFGIIPSRRRPYVAPPPTASSILYLLGEDLSGADLDTIATWPDRSGNGFDATQSSSTLKPSLRFSQVNGKKVARFDGSNDILSVADNSTLDVTTTTIMAVAKVAGSGSGNAWFAFKNASTSSGSAPFGFGRYMVGGSSGKAAFPFNTGSWADHASTSTWSTGAWRLYTGIFDGSNWYIRVNGVQDGTAAVSGSFVTTSGALTIGGYNASFSSSEYMNGDLVLIQLWASALTGSTLTDQENAIMVYYGLT